MVKNLHSTFATVKKHFPLRNVIKIMTNMNLLSEQFTTRWINFSMDEISIKSPKYNIINYYFGIFVNITETTFHFSLLLIIQNCMVRFL